MIGCNIEPVICNWESIWPLTNVWYIF
jgi:hypothetical protein